MIDLYEEKLKRMTDAQLIDECNFHGHVMENCALVNGPMTKEQKVRAITAFNMASERTGLQQDKEVFLIALRVLRLL